ncbi:NAD/NADP octopine/nopaline dehydrogenase family protein [Parapedobacter sp.]
MNQATNITILGGGHGAHAMAVDLIDKGFSVSLFEMEQFSEQVRTLFETHTIESVGEVNGKYKLKLVTSDIEAAVAGADILIIVTPAFAHKPYAELLKGKIKEHQILLIYPGAFSALLFKSVFGDHPLPLIGEVNNLPYDTRLIGPGKVNILGRNPVNIGVFPACRSSELLARVEKIHVFERVYDDVLEAGLSIVNPTFHSGLCLLSVTAIENSAKRPFFLYEHGVTPASVKLNLQLDLERKLIGKALGYDLQPIEDFSGMRVGYSWRELYMNIHGNISLTPISGPHSIESRYFTEDAPYGLVPWSLIGRAYGVGTPVIDSIITIYNVIHEKDWRQVGRSLADMGIEGLGVDELKHFLKTGERS